MSMMNFVYVGWDIKEIPRSFKSLENLKTHFTKKPTNGCDM